MAVKRATLGTIQTSIQTLQTDMTSIKAWVSAHEEVDRQNTKDLIDQFRILNENLGQRLDKLEMPLRERAAARRWFESSLGVARTALVVVASALGTFAAIKTAFRHWLGLP